ncbi:DNA methyltransferase [Streptomyces melanosporofaciens]|uniref:DNA methylase n=1 Tax=Streptomyces melanosporofaciens TaxID=67327 RepID=A0A1H4KMQ0_STRMJ|nr:DNA methyltransferase [Streptomyces melanosporofaciens]SEB59757.1 DNA methylase [Streptomyces melanosporofaciens]
MADQFPPLCWVGPPLSVWATGQHDASLQLARGPYVRATVQDTARMPPAIAGYAIATYTRPGDTVLDPECGTGTVLVEALRAGRHALGITRHHRWRAIARANITATKRDGAVPDGMVLESPSDATATRRAGLASHSDLLLTTWRPPLRSCVHSADEFGTGTAAKEAAATDRLHALLASCQALIRPGGHVIVVVPRYRSGDVLLDLPGHVVRAGWAGGLLPVERCVALLGELRGSHLVARASVAQRRSVARHGRAHGKPIMLTAHQDVLIFQTPRRTAAGAFSVPPPGPRDCLQL